MGRVPWHFKSAMPKVIGTNSCYFEMILIGTNGQQKSERHVVYFKSKKTKYNFSETEIRGVKCDIRDLLKRKDLKHQILL